MKPANILHIGGRYLLADFGASRIAERTNTMSLNGTPLYMAPEVAANLGSAGEARYGHAVDWWSLGIVCLALIDKCVFNNERSLVDGFYDGGKRKTLQAEVDQFLVKEMLGDLNTFLAAHAKKWLVVDPLERQKGR